MKCFVIMPFGDAAADAEQAGEWEALYEWIKRTVESIVVPETGERIVCHRADKEVRPGRIIEHVIENLFDSDIVVADLTGQRPNVFYELGVRHALHSNTILIAQSIDDIPFDLRPQRAFVYRNNVAHLLRLHDHLVDAVLKIIDTPDFIDNPVGDFLQRHKIAVRMSQPPSGYDEMKNMFAELASVKKGFEAMTDEVRRITRAVTSAESPDAPPGRGPLEDLKKIEGVWVSEGGSVYCARVVRGELLIPYIYDSHPCLTGHYYNCKVIGDTLFARFEWFSGNISGYAFHRAAGADKLEGGWWLSEDVPEEVMRDISRINARMPGMTGSVWRRTGSAAQFPPWAEDYFEGLERGEPGAD